MFFTIALSSFVWSCIDLERLALWSSTSAALAARAASCSLFRWVSDLGCARAFRILRFRSLFICSTASTAPQHPQLETRRVSAVV